MASFTTMFSEPLFCHLWNEGYYTPLHEHCWGWGLLSISISWVLMVKQQNLRWNVKWSQKQSTIWKRRWILFQLRIKQNHFPFYSSQPGCLLLATPQPHCSAPRLIVPFSWPEQSVTVEALVFLHQKHLQRATACICVSLQNKKML